MSPESSPKSSPESSPQSSRESSFASSSESTPAMRAKSAADSSRASRLRPLLLVALLALSRPGTGAAASPAVLPNAGLLREIAMAEDRRDWAGGVAQRALAHADAP